MLLLVQGSFLPIAGLFFYPDRPRSNSYPFLYAPVLSISSVEDCTYVFSRGAVCNTCISAETQDADSIQRVSVLGALAAPARSRLPRAGPCWVASAPCGSRVCRACGMAAASQPIFLYC